MNWTVFVIGPWIGLFLMYIFLSQLMPMKYSYWKVGLLLLPEVIPAVLKIIFGSTSPIAMVTTVIYAIYGVIILPVLCFDAPRWKSIALAIFFYMITFLIDTFCFSVLAPLLGVSGFGEDFNSLQMAIYCSTVWSTYALICALIIWLFKLLRFQQFQPFYLLYMIFPLGQGIMLYSSIYGISKFLWPIGILLSLGAQVILLLYTMSQEKKTELERQVNSLQHAMELEQTHYKEVEKRQEEMARIRHDFNNQLAAIGQLYRAGEDAAAEQLEQEMVASIQKTKENIYCSIPVVNAILNEKAQLCSENEIELDTELVIPRSCSVDALSLCSIFSNLLDNAIRAVAVLKKEHRQIRLVAKMDGDYLFVKTVNPAPPSAGKKPQRQGYGKLILKDIAEKYNGSFQFTTDNDICTAVISVAAK